MTPASRQDVQSLVDMACNRVLQRLLTKYDIQTITEISRDRVLNAVQNYHNQD
ncbi:MAG: hypothetical protein JWS12_468, partial [Candidatus Saccharibacteria bacterium]|nr:hypothetical protein [Candidatus Saccharibacteria bacterium]